MIERNGGSMDDLISRKAAIEIASGFCHPANIAKELAKLPSAQPDSKELSGTHKALDTVSRQAAIDAHYEYCNKHPDAGFPVWSLKILEDLPSAQPEQHTCVNCGRTVNNGGWYADGRTRCPIEEHYALPKDGYCHLWEKRNITDDDYPERRTDESN